MQENSAAVNVLRKNEIIPTTNGLEENVGKIKGFAKFLSVHT